jgi:acyl-CoA synthetase (NDP forming)
MYFPAPPTMGPAVMADSGAFKGHALDYAERIGIDLPKLSPEIHKALEPVMPVYAPPSNPLDMTAQAIKEPEMYDKSLPLLLADPRIGSLLLAPIMGSTGFGLAKGQRILNVVKGAAKPVIMSNLGFDVAVTPELVEECHRLGFPYFPSPERALRALAYITHFARALARPPAPDIAVPRDFIATLAKQDAPLGAVALSVKGIRDPEWGPILEVGFAGTWAEALPDTVVLPPDLAPGDIADELRKLLGATLFAGRDLDGPCTVIARIGAALRSGNADLTATVPV